MDKKKHLQRFSVARITHSDQRDHKPTRKTRPRTLSRRAIRKRLANAGLRGDQLNKLSRAVSGRGAFSAPGTSYLGHTKEGLTQIAGRRLRHKLIKGVAATFLVLDEFGYYCQIFNDSLKEDLRKIEGVPNATYLVRNGQVFVFDKLVKLVDERRKLQCGLPLADLARSLIEEATVSAKEAVDAWGIVPEPYEMVEHPHLMIRHRAFKARLPGVFQNKVEVQDAFANLLLGGIQPGNGDFVYCGQPMTLCTPLDTGLLPPRPAIQLVEEPEHLGYTTLGSVEYEPGFKPISKALFEDVKEREASWKSDSYHAISYAQDHAGDIWAQTAALQLETLNSLTDHVADYGWEDFAELRPLYPELSMLSDGSLYAWFDLYQKDCYFISGWTARRDDDFLFYLLGKVADRKLERNTEREVGQWAAYALLRGDSLDDALAFGRAADLYDGAISRLARRIEVAMRFVAKDKKRAEVHGPAIQTTMDMFRLARMGNFRPVPAEQSGV